VGAIKGQLIQSNNSFSFIDISHQLSPFNYPLAAYVCRNAMKNFPPGCFHLILVNMFDQRPDHMLIAVHNGHIIGCADNGLLTMILEEPPQKVVAVPLDKAAHKNTLYCTKVLADAFAQLIAGTPLDDLGDSSIVIDVKKAVATAGGRTLY